MPNSIIRIRMFQMDTSSNKVNLASFSYLVYDSVPFFDYVVPLLTFWLEKFHDNIGFKARGLMNSTQGIMKYSARAWSEGTPAPVEGSHVEWNVPPADRYGVFDVPSQIPQGQSPKINYTLRRSGAFEIEDYGTPPIRGKSVQFFTSPEAWSFNPPILGDAYDEAVVLRDALNSSFSLESIPVLEVPELTAYPIHCRFVYDDELLSSDPDASNNDELLGYHSLGNGEFSLDPRYPKKNRLRSGL